ncbi:MAG: hypothetical protein ABIC96_03895 [Patescibacteria group bacterium]
MSSVILDNWTVYYAADAGADAGMKQIKWTGVGTPETTTNTVKELYSAVADLFSIAAQNEADDTVPIRAVTPSVYEIGAFDAGDLEPWFIDPESIKHLTGGSIQTVDWTRDPLPADGTGTIGILKITRSESTNIQDTDIGATITNTTGGDEGWLLHIDGNDLWIRPDTNTSDDDWDTTGGSGDLVCNGHTDTQATAGVTGERLWSNIFTLGTIEANTQMFIYQNFTKITSFWNPGHIDRLFLTNDSFDAGLIDYGLITVFARQYSKFYDHYAADVSGGGRNPVPIGTIADTNNTTGYYQTVFSESTGVWAKGQTFTKDGDSTRQGTVTSATGSNPDTIQYYLSGSSLALFSNLDEVTSSGGGPATGIVQTPTEVGPANLAAITITFGYDNTKDLGDGNGPLPYDVVIDCGGNTLADFYEYTKYITRRGNIADIDDGGQTIKGESYITPGEIRLSYDSQSQAFTEGATLTGQISGATGIITADNTTDDILVVRNARGTFVDDENIQDNQGPPGNADILASGGIETTVIIKGSPFGTLAGVKFFGTRGVWIENMHADDANNYQLIDSNGETRDPPATVPISVTVKDVNNAAIENAQVFVRKDTAYYNYTSDAGNNAGDADFVVNEVVDTDLLQTGWLHVWDASANTKQNYRYASWTGKTFTLRGEVTGTADAGGSETTLKRKTGTSFLSADIEEGDTVRNTTDVSWATVDEIVDADTITTSALQGGSDNTWSEDDGYSFHKLAINYTDDDDLVDIPLMNKQTNVSGIASATYGGSTPMNIIVRIRLNEGTPKYVPFNTSGVIGVGTGFSLTAILTEDTVAA